MFNLSFIVKKTFTKLSTVCNLTVVELYTFECLNTFYSYLCFSKLSIKFKTSYNSIKFVY